jgi:hypothetical protein
MIEFDDPDWIYETTHGTMLCHEWFSYVQKTSTENSRITRISWSLSRKDPPLGTDRKTTTRPLHL